MIRKSVLICLACIISVILCGQNSLAVHSNKPFYSSGEQIGIVVSNMSHEGDEIVYIELLTKDGKIIDIQSVRSESNICTTVFTVPADVKSDWYVIRAYTIWNPSLQIKDVGYRTLALYNEFESFDPTPSVILPKTGSTPEDGISIVTNRDRYKKGEVVEVTATFLSPDPQRSTNVIITSVVHSPTYQLMKSFEQLVPQIPDVKFRSPPVDNQKINKLLFVGRVNEDIGNVLGAVYVVEARALSWVPITENQTFGIDLEDFEGQRHVQYIGMKPLGDIKYFGVDMMTFSSIIKWPEFKWAPLPYPSGILKYLESARKRKIIDDIFNLPGKIDIVEDQIESSFIKADRSYTPDNFIRFKDTRDFISEVIPFFIIKKDGEELTYRLRLEKNILSLSEPLLFLNGHMVTKISDLLDIDLDDLERIDLFRKEKSLDEQFGILGKNGAVVFYTKDHSIRSLSSSEFILNGFEPLMNTIDPVILPEHPHFAPLLYWNATARDSDSVGFSFDVSHDKGEYIIVVERHSNSGNQKTTKSILLGGKSKG